MTETDFLNTLYLTDDQRAKLRLVDLDSPAAIVALSAAEIAAHTGLTIGKAGVVLSAAQEAQSARRAAAAADRDHEAKQSTLTLALQAVRADPQAHRRKALGDLGVQYVVIDGEDKVDVEASCALLRDLENGAPVPQTWQGQRVVRVSELGAPTVFCHPRTGEALQAGVDKVGVPWGELGLAWLRLAAFAYREDLVHGMTDRAVFEGLRDDVDKLRSKLMGWAKARKADLASLDAVVVYQARPPTPARPVDIYRNSSPHETPLQQLAVGTVRARLTTLLLACFSSDEMRRFIRYFDEGLAASLPGATASPMETASAAADLLVPHGRLDRSLRDRLIAERPRRVNEIDAFFNSIA